MDIGSILIGGLLISVIAYALYEQIKPASGERARNAKGHFVKDDKATPTVNEAYVDSKTPTKKKRKATVKKKVAVKKKTVAKKAPAKRGRPRKTVKNKVK